MPPSWLLASLNGIAQDAQNHWARQRRARTVAQLSQQCHQPRRNLAALTLQMPSGGLTLPDLPATRHLTYLSPLWQACQDVSFSRGSGRSCDVRAMDEV